MIAKRYLRAKRQESFISVISIFSLVGMQMGWMLRPFVGTPGRPVTFFREEPFSNAYVVIARLVFGA